MKYLGEWDFFYGWYWKPIIEPVLGFIWVASFVLLAVLIYSFISARTKLSDYREMFLLPEEIGKKLPEEEEEIQRYLNTYFPDVSEDEILDMEEILEAVIREDIHPEMALEIENRGIPVHLLDLPSPAVVKEIGSVPLAVWVPSMGAIEIYASLMKVHCNGNEKEYRNYMGKLLLHEMAHALGLDEPKIKDFGV